MATPAQILIRVLKKASKHVNKPLVNDAGTLARVDYICRCLSNRAGVRLLMACMLAKCHKPKLDPRQPYTEIGADTSFSGRAYDEQYLTAFIHRNRLPCNPTTAFLTPGLRNLNRTLLTNLIMVGRPPQMYTDTLQVLGDVAQGKVSAEGVLAEAIRILLIVRNEKEARMASLLAGMTKNKGALPLSSECIVTLIEQHLACRHSSRLPVLVVAAAYKVASEKLGEYANPLQSHNAADEQTGALGDVEICLMNDDRVVTIYEMKMKRVLNEDIDRAVQKIAAQQSRIDNYIFITTDAIDAVVKEYAFSMYEQTGGTEFAVLDCIGFIRHFLHLFHRLRIQFLDCYQELVLYEPDSAVKQPLKEAFLTLRQAAEAEA